MRLLEQFFSLIKRLSVHHFTQAKHGYVHYPDVYCIVCVFIVCASGLRLKVSGLCTQCAPHMPVREPCLAHTQAKKESCMYMSEMVYAVI